ncbi:MAG: hypothetical protein M3342_24275, partial [Bacteroidota bacterium]|nr:hypothetical protein [Bacteroidota bacterium]
IRQSELYFLRFYKRLQGVSFYTENKVAARTQSKTLVSGSIAKGKFTRNVFQGLEGNQGPYRLTGANNEIFFIVLSGTERVFLDGELLQRGEDADYVINYNTAEVTFMPRRMITKDARIQIEFEYADRNFLNANLFVRQSVEVNKKLTVNVAAYTNSDAKNSSINQVLNAGQRQFLAGIGDSIQKAFYPAVALDSFSTSKVLYEKVYDTTGNRTDSFYRYATDSATARFTLSFTDVGAGNGNYVPDFNNTNGRVYRYVRPLNGVKQGSYEPVLLLVTPKKQQLITIITDYRINEQNGLKTEFAISRYDINTFSKLNSGDDDGLAAKVQYNNTVLLRRRGRLQLLSQVDWEHVQQKFRPVERLRSVEFTRDWGLPIIVKPATENIIQLATQLKDSSNNTASYQFITYQRSDNYKGYQNILQHTSNLKGWMMNNRLALTNFSTLSDKGFFLRPVLDVSKVLQRFSALRVGFRYALEQNEVRDKRTDSVSPLSFSFDTYSAYLKTDESKKNRYGITLFTRTDRYPLGKKLESGDKSYNINFQTELLKNPRHQFLLNTTFRKLMVQNKAISREKEDNTLLGRAEYNINEWKGLDTGNVLYELGTGQEQRRDFTYIEVPAGQGEYTWIDYNNDNIQQLNEFEIAQYNDQAKFVRLFIPTNQFVKAGYTTLNYSFQFNPKAVLSGNNSKGWSRFISRWNWQTSMQTTRKSVAKGDMEFNPFKYGLTDTALLTLTTSFINTLSFNRYSSKWGVDFSNLKNSGKALLTYGYESRRLNDWLLKTRWVLSRSLTLNIDMKKGLTALYTARFDNRNYELQTYSVEPRIVFISGTIFRLQTGYGFTQKANRPEYGGQQSTSHAVNVETKYNVLQNSSVLAKFTFNDIAFPYSTNTTVSYIMLDALM